MDLPARELRVINEEDFRNHSLVGEDYEVKQINGEVFRHKVHNKVDTINHSQTVLGTTNRNQQLIGVTDSSHKVAKETMDVGSRVLGEEVMHRQLLEEDIRVNPSLTSQH